MSSASKSMRSSVAALAALVALALPFQANAQAVPAPGPVHINATDSGLNVRTGPGTEFPKIGRLRPAQGGVVLGCNATGRWCEMGFEDGGRGWVYMPLTRPLAAAAALRQPVDWRQLYRPDVAYIHTGTGRVNLRQGAGTHRTVIGKLHPGQGGYVQGCSADAQWCLLTFPPNGYEAWVYMPLLKPAA